MIPVISSSPMRTNVNFVSQDPSHLSKTKIERVALFFFAGLSFFIGYSFFSVGTPIATFIAIACFTTCGAMLWAISRSKDYEDLKELQSYQCEALGFAEMREKHGLENMIKYEIPRARQFSNIFRTEVEAYSIDSLIRLYEEIQTKINEHHSSIQLPHPSEFKDKFEKETAGMQVYEIFEKYDIQKLYDYDIASQDLYHAATDYFTYKLYWERTVKNIKETCKRTLVAALSEFRKVLDTTNGSTPSQEGWISQLKREADFLAKAQPGAWFSSEFQILQEAPLSDHEIDESLQRLIEAQKIFTTAVKKAREAKDRALVSLETLLKNKQDDFNSLFVE